MKGIVVILLLGITAWALSATAQDMQGPPPPPDPMLKALDTNTNGVISADEIVNAPTALKTLDANSDDQLTMDELRPACPMPPQDADNTQWPPPPPPMPIVKALDTNSDGVISTDEIANASAALKTLDTNGDGQLTQDEIHPPCPMGPPLCSTNTVSE